MKAMLSAQRPPRKMRSVQVICQKRFTPATIFHKCDFLFFPSLHALLFFYSFRRDLLKHPQCMNRKCCVTGKSWDRRFCRRTLSPGDEDITMVFPRACTFFSPWALHHFTSLPPLGHEQEQFVPMSCPARGQLQENFSI